MLTNTNEISAYDWHNFDYREERPNEETRKAIEEIEKGIGLSRTFSSIDELIADLMSDD